MYIYVTIHSKATGGKLKPIYPGFKDSFEAEPVVEVMIIGWPDHVHSTSAKQDWNWKAGFNFENSKKSCLDL